MEGKQIEIIIKNPASAGEDYTVALSDDSTVYDLKRKIEKDYSGRPHPSAQKLIFAGRFLLDDVILRDAFASLGEQQRFNVHLVVSKNITQNLPANNPPQTPPQINEEQRPFNPNPEPQPAFANPNHIDAPNDLSGAFFFAMKLAFFVYMFSHGTNTWRTWVMVGGAVIIFFYHYGYNHLFGHRVEQPNANTNGVNLAPGGFIGDLFLPFFYSLFPTWDVTSAQHHPEAERLAEQPVVGAAPQFPQ
eukprot:TRINITY_DN2702_c0_g1_i1.p1 TRINITY_DN2702_c0_g1~~TRINITY_DN2702_c0_g1_i1.p1  ORF type:complete len:246 (+),score=38.88 TRINITY_DN2702_c0_g1_i1:948-1685(+)